jgi:hypothetical protein
VAATVRSVAASTISGPTGTATRGVAKTGDVLIAFQSADSGGIAPLEIGGADWLLLDAQPGGFWVGSESGTWAGCVVWKRVCTSSEPTSYPVSQGPVSDGVVVIIAIAGAVQSGIQVNGRTGTSTPSITPDSASGLEIRYVTGVPDPPGGDISWDTPGGWTERADAQSGDYTTAALATRTVVSTSPTGSLRLTPSLPLAAAAFTVVLASTEAPVPDPPVVQPFAPGKGSSAYRYVFTRMLDRTYLGDIDLVGVSFDKRILQPGSFSATIPIPNRRMGDQIAEIIPREAADEPDSYPLDRGPGVITCQVFREGEPWGEYWITRAQPSRSRRGTPAISLQGSTLDAYLGRVEIEEDLFLADDQIDIARSLLASMTNLPNANISLALLDGVSGVARERTYLESEGSTYGQRLVELAQVDDGFEWMINLELDAGSLVRRWVWGAPKLGVLDPPPHRFADGRNGADILEWKEEIDALRGATRWRARGSSTSADASTTSVPLISAPAEATAHLAAGWPRLSRTLNYGSVTEQQTLEDYAAFWAATAPGALRVDQVTVTLGKVPSLTPNHLGDAGRFYFNNEWHRGVWKTRRIIGMGVTPTSRSDGKEEARLVLEGQEAPGA